jgi:hypothetical protein
VDGNWVWFVFWLVTHGEGWRSFRPSLWTGIGFGLNFALVGGLEMRGPVELALVCIFVE